MSEDASEEKKPLPPRKDKRKAMLTYMRPELIRKLKAEAARRDQKAWQFIEAAVEKELKAKRK